MSTNNDDVYEDQYGNRIVWSELNARLAGSDTSWTPGMWFKMFMFFAFLGFCVFCLYAPAAAMWAFLPIKSLMHI